jgi:hypothetical protein
MLIRDILTPQLLEIYAYAALTPKRNNFISRDYHPTKKDHRCDEDEMIPPSPGRKETSPPAPSSKTKRET